jgi:murein DD-endopeptidase MepM/ murein hydrolase activator NlpD
MTYDDTAKKLAVKVIGTVESNLNYGSINYSDPITVGVAQWYGTRAAGVLAAMRSGNPGAWYGVAESLNNQLLSIDPASTFWNSRYLTRAEGDSLAGVLTRNQTIQNSVLTTDLEAYKTTAIAYGFDPDANTGTVIFFFSMHHQSPASALEVVETIDTTATLDQIYAAALAHPVLGQYGARYRTTYDLISAADLSGVDPAPEEPADPTNGNVRYITLVGDQLHVRFADTETVTFLPDGRGHWIGRRPATPPTPVQPAPPAGSWVHPLPGAVMTSGYGPRPTPPGSADINGGFHFGCDLAHASGAPAGNVLAPCDLVITVARAYSTANPDRGTAGNYVKGHTPDGKYTFNFFHLASAPAVTAGDTVTAGTVLGVEGATGNVTGRHLHLECYNGAITDPWPPPYGNPIDPLPVLRAHGVII